MKTEDEEEEVKLYTRQRMGFFGFATGVVLCIFLGIASNFIPPLWWALWFLYPHFVFPWNYIMTFVTPLLWGVGFFFIPYNKSKF